MKLDLSKLKSFYPLDSLSDENLMSMADKIDIEEHPRGQTLFAAGEKGGDTLFLITGSIKATYPDGTTKKIVADSMQSRYAIGNFRPHKFTGEVASRQTTIARIDRHLLEKTLAWDQVSRDTQLGASANELHSATRASEWVPKLLKTMSFLSIPTANIEALFLRLTEINVKEGDLIIQQGDEGDYFYVLKKGSCKVSRGHGVVQFPLALLKEGDVFGEEALISEEPRNATVTMTADGKLMRLSKSDFQELLTEPVLDWVNADQAAKLAKEGAVLIDVRTKEEHFNRSIKGSINIPLYLLRERSTAELNSNTKYIVYCNTGDRSSAASFILGQRGYNCFILQDGISGMDQQLDD